MKEDREAVEEGLMQIAETADPLRLRMLLQSLHFSRFFGGVIYKCMWRNKPYLERQSGLSLSNF